MPILAVLAALGLVGAAGYVLTRKPTPTPPTPLSPQPLPPTTEAASLIRSDVALDFAGMLIRGQMYRLWLLVDPSWQARVRSEAKGSTTPQAFLTDVIKSLLQRMGFAVYLSTQDPTDERVWTVLARWDSSSNTLPPSISEVRVFRMQEVEEPPVNIMTPQPEPPPSLDGGLSADEVEAIRYALERDDDPRHLGGFASVLEPDFPIASTLLIAKQKLSSARSYGPNYAAAIPKNPKTKTGGEDNLPVAIARFRLCTCCGKNVAKACLRGTQKSLYACSPICAQLLTRKLGAWRLPWERCDKPVIGWDPFETAADIAKGAAKTAEDLTPDFVKDAVKALKDAVEGMGKKVAEMWEKYGGIMEVMGGWFPGPQVWMAETAAKMLKALAEGKDVWKQLSEQSVKFAKAMQATSPFVAMIPGLGTGVAAMMNVAAGLALAEPLDQVALEGIAATIPGGPVAQDAFRTAAAFGSSIAEGKRLDEAAANAARNAVPEEFRPAYDAGIALARGKSLQEAGFQALSNLTRGNDVLDKAAHFAEDVVTAAQQGRSVKSVLIDHLGEDLSRVAKDQSDSFKQINDLIPKIRDGSWEDPTGRKVDLNALPADQLGAMLGVPEAVARAAQACIKELPGGVKIVDTNVYNRLLPWARIASQTLVKKGMSSTALQLAYAAMRPTYSNVVNPAILASKVSTIIEAAAQEREDAKKAQDAIARANKLLERRSWVEWYKKIAAAEAEGGPAPGSLTGPVMPPLMQLPQPLPPPQAIAAPQAISKVSQLISSQLASSSTAPKVDLSTTPKQAVADINAQRKGSFV